MKLILNLCVLLDFVESVSAVTMAVVAILALNTWKRKIRHEARLEAFAFRREAKAYLQRIRDPYNINLQENLKTYYERKNELKETIERVNLIYGKLRFVLKCKPKDPLLNYYKIIVETDSDFELQANKLDVIENELEAKKLEKKHYDKEHSDLQKSLYPPEILKPDVEPQDSIYNKLYVLENEMKKIYLERSYFRRCCNRLLRGN